MTTVASPTQTDGDETTQCPVCAHRLDTHDATDLRFCRATQTKALSRGCICRTV